ncbi:MAG: hypothetical protein IJ733_16130 [Lachnospiraceae bacterium]|nr:hypothetical protein [Lachnospiraceae bacterium]
MSEPKTNVIDKINRMSDDLDETELIERLYMLARLEHSIRRCEEDGVYSDAEVAEHFAKKREQRMQG